MTLDSLIEPLDKQFRMVLNKKTNTQESIPAIDKLFMEDREFLTYLPPPLHILNEINDKNQAVADEYIERLKYIEFDLKWLLSLDYQHFWSQIIYDKSFKLLIDSYLKYAPRPHDLFKLNNLPNQIIDHLNSIQKLVFLVCLRMSTYKESKENFMTPEAFSNIIYNNYLFDIPKIIDICVLFKKNDILPKMIGNLFKTQEKYFNDFKICLKDIHKTFDTSKNHLVKIFDLDGYNVNSKKENLNDRIKSNLKAIIETLYYLTDLAISLNDFITVLPEIGEILEQNQFQDNIKELFENTLLVIEEKLNKLNRESEDKNLKNSIKMINSKLRMLKYQLTKLFKKIFESCSITPILRQADETSDKKQDSKLQHYVDVFFQICSHMFEYDRFLCYYEEKFKLSDQIDIVVQLSGNNIDESQHKYLIDTLKTCVMNHSKKKSVKLRFNENIEIKRVENDSVTSKSTKQSETSSASIEIKSQSDLAVKSILDMFPDQNVSLIKKCLKYFNNNIEEVINAFLENNIPEFPPEPIEKLEDNKTSYLDYDNDDVDYEGLNLKQDELSGLNQRRNIYDGDEFDVFKKDSIDKSKIVLGKKNTTDTFDLDNKDDLNREYIRVISEENQDEYEDEYDDTYDENTNTVETETESFIKIRPLNQKLEIKKRDQFELEDEEDEEIERDELIETAKKQLPSNQQQDFRSNQTRNQNFQPSKQQHQQQPQKQQRDFHKQGQRQQNYNQTEDNTYNQKQYQQHQQQQYNNQADDKNFQRQHQQHQQHQKGFSNQQFRSNNNQQQQQQQQQNRPLPQRQNNRSKVNNYDDEEEPQQQQFKPNNNQQQQQNRPLPQRQNNRPKRNNYDDEEELHQQQNAIGAEATAAAAAPPKTEEEIKRERRWKNDNKSKIVHHNRKDLSAKKMNFY